VPGFPSFLDRFRRHLAPPGRPGEAVGVPASGQEVGGELEPLLTQLDAVAVEAQEIERGAIRQADERRAQAQAQAILEHARQRAEEERAKAVLEQRAELQRERIKLHEASAREVKRIRAARADRVPELVSEVLACVRRSGR
jgi:hypothetical protein